MRTHTLTPTKGKRSGQTLVIAMIVLGVLLVIGFVFLGIVSRNVASTALARRRTAARELAEAGVRFAHGQLLVSLQGADWRPAATALQPVAGNPDATRDPDMLYLRPPGGFQLGGAGSPLDKGGPDGLGSYSRVEFPNGRALVRVRYAPSDANVFSNTPTGPLRNPGRARTFTIIESVGRPGRVLFNDPTTLLAGSSSIQFRNYVDQAQFLQALTRMRTADQQLSANTNKAIAFASIGIIESGRFITDRDQSNRVADIGTDRELNAPFRGIDVATGKRLSDGVLVTRPLTMTMGTSLSTFGSPLPAPPEVDFGGSLYSNTDLRIHGAVTARLNASLGDGWNVNGLYLGADDDAALTLDYSYFEDFGAGLTWVAPGAVILENDTNPSLNSRSPNFRTVKGSIRDRVPQTDEEGYPRGVGRKQPPSILATDPDTGLTRFITMTREAGVLIGGGNSGRFGHGRGVYVHNFADRQTRVDQQGRERLATAESLVQDWLNPNNGQAGSGWQGPFYVPRGAYMLLQEDGFSIVRDARAPAGQRFWLWPDGQQPRSPTGTLVQSSTIRYRIRRIDHDGDPATPMALYIVNTFTPDPLSGTPPTRSIDINSNLDDSVFLSAGQPFNGVIYYEGNVRLRGTIPTDEQLTVVSNATIYVEGSVTKGISLRGVRLTQPSRSMIGLLARDYVALNTTQFFGAAPEAALEEADDRQSALTYNPVRVRQGGSLSLWTEFLLDPSATPYDPSAWPLYAQTYREFNTPTTDDGPPLDTLMMLSHTGDDGPAPATFMGMAVNFGVDTAGTPTPPSTEDWVYHFLMSDNNAATQPYLSQGYAAGSYVPDYGLGVEPWQRYPRFETIGFPLLDDTLVFDGLRQLWHRPNAGADMGSYGVFDQSSSFISIAPTALGSLPTNDYLVARAALVPHDVRIEAVMYAEQGAFFVIPGPPFNPNPNDRWEVFEQAVLDYGGFGSADAIRRAQRERLENFGTFPETPFYGEPVDVRVTIVGAISENMPPPMSQQAAWLRRWGWIPSRIGAMYDFSGATPRPVLIPKAHVPAGYNINPGAPTPDLFVPNLILSYDPHLATGQTRGFDPVGVPIRWDESGRVLPPVPRLPVSPTLAYFGEVTG